jgi:hypothetical protein
MLLPSKRADNPAIALAISLLLVFPALVNGVGHDDLI